MHPHIPSEQAIDSLEAGVGIAPAYTALQADESFITSSGYGICHPRNQLNRSFVARHVLRWLGYANVSVWVQHQ